MWPRAWPSRGSRCRWRGFARYSPRQRHPLRRNDARHPQLHRSSPAAGRASRPRRTRPLRTGVLCSRAARRAPLARLAPPHRWRPRARMGGTLARHRRDCGAAGTSAAVPSPHAHARLRPRSPGTLARRCVGKIRPAARIARIRRRPLSHGPSLPRFQRTNHARLPARTSPPARLPPRHSRTRHRRRSRRLLRRAGSRRPFNCGSCADTRRAGRSRTR
jgi:hypothetical protein